jgi:hypothetical protein
MRAYVRLDTRFPEHKENYPDGPLATLALLIPLAEQQPDRGRFRPQVLKALLGRRARWVRYLVEHHDLVVEEDGTLYLEGWTEWNEGNWQVAERMRRVRERKRNADRNSGDGQDRNARYGANRNAAVDSRARGAQSTVQRAKSSVQSALGDRPPAAVEGVHSENRSLPELDPEAEALVAGYQLLNGGRVTATDRLKAGEFVAELRPRLPVPAMLERMASHLAWCKAHGKPAPRGLGGFWNTLRLEADHITDSGGLSRAGDVLRGGEA